MNKFYVSFLIHHTHYGDKTPRGYIIIYAPDEYKAREVAHAHFNDEWGFIGTDEPKLLGSVGLLDELFYQVVEGRILKKSDIGSPMTYIPHHAKGDASHPDAEQGHLSSFNENGIWVRFKSTTGAKCDPGNLKWG